MYKVVIDMKKKPKKLRDFSQVLEVLEEEQESLENAEMSYSALRDYHSALVISAKLKLIDHLMIRFQLM
jgi:hypothetical protein